MLKKISHIILSLLLLITTMGMAVSKHYCHGNVMSVSLFGESKSNCDMGSCCHDESHFYQVKDNFSTPVVLDAPLIAELDILGHDLFEIEGLQGFEDENSTSFVTDLLPPKTIQTVLSLKQVYLL